MVKSITKLTAFLVGFPVLAGANTQPGVLAKDSVPVSVNWNKVEGTSRTSLSVQVCPEPPMRRSHRTSKNIYKALRELKIDYARLQPWYPYPRLGVAELKPPADGQTFWDFSTIDPIVLDFFAAAEGRPVMINFSTIPQWMIKTDTVVKYPDDPDEVAWNYSPGNEFRDTTLKELVSYYHRLVSWYTKGGFTDEYGKYHRSGYHFKIDYWEVLNENDERSQHLFGPQQLARIYDAVVGDLKKLDPGMKFSALALAFPHKGAPYVSYFLDTANHLPGIPLDMFSYHTYIAPEGDKWEEGNALDRQLHTYFDRVDGFLKTVDTLNTIKNRLSPHTKIYINELGTLPVGNPSDPKLVIPDYYWPVCSAAFAYAYVGIVKREINILAIAELIDYPGQFAGTTITDWNTGLPNARYWGMKLLRDNFEAGDKLVESTTQNEELCAQAFITGKDKRKVLLINKTNGIIDVKLSGADGGKMNYVDVSTGNNPPASVQLKTDALSLKAHAVAVVTLK